MFAVGIDMGSTCTKLIVLDGSGELFYRQVRPTGWDCVAASAEILDALAAAGVAAGSFRCVATGYGRAAVPFAHKTVTEITCHGKGAAHLFGQGSFTVVDIGGQDTKIIELENGAVKDFNMNDKCSAGTGKFLEVMAAALGVNVDGLCALARESKNRVTISSMCTVFAESEVVSLIGKGTDKADIAHGIVESIAGKVKSQMGRGRPDRAVYLTGGLCETPFILEILSEKLGTEVRSNPLARYAGALGAALLAAKQD